MKVFLVFLLGAFALGAIRRLEPVGRRWPVVLVITIAIAASFYSMRVVG